MLYYDYLEAGNAIQLIVNQEFDDRLIPKNTCQFDFHTIFLIVCALHNVE